MPVNPTNYSEKITLTNCDREPIHIIGKSQEHGVILIVNRETLNITQVSENVEEILGFNLKSLLGNNLKKIMPEKEFENLQKKLQDHSALLPMTLEFQNTKFFVIPHLSEENLIIDFEPYGEDVDPIIFQDQLTRILQELGNTESIYEMCQSAVDLVKSLFGYDRVMMYRFDEEWNGEVVAEVHEKALESWLGLRYPATDIPKPAREIFLKQGVRIIADVNYNPSKIQPEISPITNAPVDISKSELRAVSPIHIEYLRNMKVGASLTAAIILNGDLWGLLTCHHYSPKFINYHQRQSCRFLTQVFSNKLALKTAKISLQHYAHSEEVRKKLVNQMSSVGNLTDSLTRFEPNFTNIIDCGGGALIMNREIKLLGDTPTEKQIKKLLKKFICKKDTKLFFTKNLMQNYPEAIKFKDSASGVLSISIGEERENFLMFFRPQVSNLVNWGGNPEKHGKVIEGEEYLTPRKSFEKWTEQVDGVSNPWNSYEFEAVEKLSESITHIMVKKQKDTINQLNKDLKEANEELKSFSYSVSHDLRAPLRGIDGYARILKDHYSENMDDYSQNAVETILKSAGEMDVLIEDILSYSQVGQTKLKKSMFSTKLMVDDIIQSQNPDKNYPKTSIIIDDKLPRLFGDKRMISQLYHNLISNALKYSSKNDHPIVEIGFEMKNENVHYFVRDNGIGIDAELKDSIFDIFSRIATQDFQGSGIGLATAKKVVDKHQGKLWVESIPHKGSVFYFLIPEVPAEND